MKCQHCGINFDDDERVCPICGARAGSRGRLSKPRCILHKQTQAERKPPRKTIINGKTKKEPAGDKRKIVAIAVGLFTIISQVIPLVLNLADDSFDNAVHEFMDSPPASSTPDYEYITMYDFIGEQAIAILSTGETLYMSAQPDGFYSLYVEGDWTMEEYGYADLAPWDRYADGNEVLYNEVFPEESYTDYVAFFGADSIQPNGERAGLEDHLQSGGMQLLLHVSNDGSEIVLEDYYGEASFLFGDELFLALVPMDTEDA